MKNSGKSVTRAIYNNNIYPCINYNIAISVVSINLAVFNWYVAGNRS